MHNDCGILWISPIPRGKGLGSHPGVHVFLTEMLNSTKLWTIYQGSAKKGTVHHDLRALWSCKNLKISIHQSVYMGLSRNPLVKLGDPNIPNQMRLNGRHSIISGECHQTLPRPSRCQSSLFQVIAPAWTQGQVRGPCSLLFHLGASSKYVVFWCSLVWQSNLSSWKRRKKKCFLKNYITTIGVR